MKLAMIHGQFPPYANGGAERSVATIARAHLDAGGEVELITLCPDGGYHREQRDRLIVHFLPLWNVCWPWRFGGPPKLLKPIFTALDSDNPVMAKRVATLLDRIRPDLISLHNLKGFSPRVISVAARRAPSVVVCHDPYLICPRATMYHKGAVCQSACGSCGVFLGPRVRHTAKAHGAVAVGTDLASKLKQAGLFKHSDVTVIHSPVAPPPVPPPLPSTPVTFGFLGRIELVKGVETLIAASARLPAGARVLIAGSGDAEYMAKLGDLATGRPVEFLGQLPPAELFARCHILVVPSLWSEPFGRVTLEAFQHGRPVIATNQGGSLDLIDQGRTGWLVPPDDSDRLSEAMIEAMDVDRLAVMSADCRARGMEITPDQVYAGMRKVWDNAFHTYKLLHVAA
ncbi:glycosyltransferase (plasmid) [Skermanella sp. TT6]|uniref:Glycosyltransferase n=1 Tax=Skermanella cutis TaxID=2775420 RepID=A0ABX7BEB1_9PROT|nr:glycosyltransferase [Skermanella sp. TT6]QQP92744.1 glycosyltransferase [Skermanella sp. TT6]